MVDLRKRNGTARESLDRASRAIADALAEGVDERELLDMVTTVATEQLVEQPDILGLFPGPESIYAEVPDGLIDLPTASRKYGLNRGTLHTWVHTGRLTVVGRLKAPAAGGGYLIVKESDLVEYMSAPRNKGGRPRKT